MPARLYLALPSITLRCQVTLDPSGPHCAPHKGLDLVIPRVSPHMPTFL